jgi:hypothetical protein
VTYPLPESGLVDGVTTGRIAHTHMIYKKLNRAWIDVRTDFGATGDGSTNDATMIQNAFNAATPGTVIYFPRPPSFYRITSEIQVRTSGLTIRGASRDVEIQQQTWLKPAFDILDCDDVTVENLFLNYTGTNRTMPADQIFRAQSNPYTFSAGVWTNGHRNTVQQCNIRRFAVGVFFSAYNSATTQYEHGKQGNRILDCEIWNIDHGTLYLGQIGIEIGRVYTHDHIDSSGGTNPPHSTYSVGNSTGNLPGSEEANVHDLICINNNVGHAFQAKYSLGGTMTNLTAENCQGLLNTVDLRDVMLSNFVGRNIDNPGGGAAITFGHINGNARCVFNGLHLTMVPGKRALQLRGDDMRYSDFNIVSNRDAVSPDGEFCVYLYGSRNIIDGLTIKEIGNPTRPILVGAAGITANDNTIRNLALDGTKSIADIYTTSTGTVISYHPAALRNLTGTTYIAALGGTATWSLARDEYTRTATFSANGTLTPIPAMETVSRANVTTNGVTVTIGAPTGTYQVGMTHTILVSNSSAGTIVLPVWNAAWSLNGAAPSAPASGRTLMVYFMYDGTVWREISRTA